MKMKPDVRIDEVRVEPGPGELTVSWTDNTRLKVNLSGWFERYPILAPLRDRAIFETAQVGEYGAEVRWGDNDDLAIDIDHLRLIAEEQRPFGRDAILLWQNDMKLSDEEASEFLKIDRRTFLAYKSGEAPVPPQTAMICRASERDSILMHAHYRPRSHERPKKLAS